MTRKPNIPIKSRKRRPRAGEAIELTRAQKNMVGSTPRRGIVLSALSSESSRRRTVEVLERYGLVQTAPVAWSKTDTDLVVRLTPRGLRYLRGTRTKTDPVFTYQGITHNRIRVSHNRIRVW